MANKEKTAVAEPKTKTKSKASIDDVLSAINGLTDVVSSLVKSTLATPASVPVAEKVAPAIQQPEPANDPQKFPVPQEYRLIVENTLNKRFGVEINYVGDIASFEFSILVPREYSNAAKPHWDTYKEDRRSKVIANALGINGVREWASKVYENFPNETKSQIVFDRAQP